MYQSNQAFAQISSVVPALEGTTGSIVFGGLLALAVGSVIIGGIRRIGEVAGVVVPLMCVAYVFCGLLILLAHAGSLGHGLAVIFQRAFSMEAGAGAFVGVLIQGFRRAAFSNEAGCGSAAIAHSAAATSQPVREGVVALLEPFIDTIVVCTTTGLVIVVTGAYDDPNAGEGIRMTAYAFGSVFPWFPTVLSIIAIVFAFSTMISWSYYGEQCWATLFGVRSIFVYKAIFLVFVWAGAVFDPGAVLDFGDYMILGMAFPNILGVFLLSGIVKADLAKYLDQLKRGELISNA
jgi:AGCS family alanine or glycine:cation symporter